MTIKHLTLKSFDEFTKTGTTVVDFSAEWCGPCKILNPIFEDVAGKVKNVKFGKVDVDAENELAQRFYVMSVPTLVYFKDGKQVDMTVGVLSKEELTKKAEKLINK